MPYNTTAGRIQEGRSIVTHGIRESGRVTNLFRPGLSDNLFEDLMDCPYATMLQAYVQVGIDVRLRANAVNLYFRGRSMANPGLVEGRSRKSAWRRENWCYRGK